MIIPMLTLTKTDFFVPEFGGVSVGVEDGFVGSGTEPKVHNA